MQPFAVICINNLDRLIIYYFYVSYDFPLPSRPRIIPPSKGTKIDYNFIHNKALCKLNINSRLFFESVHHITAHLILHKVYYLSPGEGKVFMYIATDDPKKIYDYLNKKIVSVERQLEKIEIL